MATHTTTDNRVTVWAPDDPAWEMEAAISGPATQLKCKNLGPDRFCFLTAKIYTVPMDQVLPADTLLRETYPAIYAKKFQSVKLDSMGEVTGSDGEKWTQALYDLVHANVGAITKIERVRCAGPDVMVASAEGIPADMERHVDIVFAWMDRARFGADSLARSIGDPLLAALGVKPNKP